MIRQVNGVQFITYHQLAEDVATWVRRLPVDEISLVAGIPRSGLTVAHMVSAHLNVPCVQLHSPEWRQKYGRMLKRKEGKVLVVDDCVSSGNCLKQAQQQIEGAFFGAVYAREPGREQVDFWHRKHGDENWMVVTEWNWRDHFFETPMIAVTPEVKLRHSVPWHSRIGGENAEQILDMFQESTAGMLATSRIDVRHVGKKANKPVLFIPTMELVGERQWKRRVFGVGLPRTGTCSLLRALQHLGRSVKHHPLDFESLDSWECSADVFTAGHVEYLKSRYPEAVFILTERDTESWWNSMRQTPPPDAINLEGWPELLENTMPSSLSPKEKYDRHTERVLSACPDVVRLNMNIGWERLCHALGEPVPSIPFPHANNKNVKSVGFAC